jgi:hypothetical protein
MRVPSFVSSTENFHSSRTAFMSFKKLFNSRLFAEISRPTSAFDIRIHPRNFRTRKSLISVCLILRSRATARGAPARPRNSETTDSVRVDGRSSSPSGDGPTPYSLPGRGFPDLSGTLEAKSSDSPARRGGGRSTAQDRLARLLLPTPVSDRRGTFLLILGFAVEGATELYQFLARGNLVQGAAEYYTTLATTLLGFYLMFLGLRERHAFHPSVRPKRSATGARRWPWFGLSLWAGGTAVTGLLSIALGGGSANVAPFWVAWPVGGVVVLAFGNFFFGLRKEAELGGSRWAAALGWTAFVWSLGVAAVAGLVVGERILQLIGEFVSNWVALVASIGPVVVAMSPLFVTYGLMIGAFGGILLPARDSRP